MAVLGLFGLAGIYRGGRGVPDHSSLSKIRKRLDAETHEAVFAYVLGLLADEGLAGGGAHGIDATTLEASAAMRAIVRRDGGQDYRAFLRGLAEAAGVDDPTAAALAALDRKREKKTASNRERAHLHDADEGRADADGVQG